jgi:large conductance mechanosensitive channel
MMPPLGMLLGGVDMTNVFVVIKEGTPPGPYVSLEQAKSAGAVTMNFGLFLNALVSFVLVAFAVFLLVRSIERARREPGALPDTKECPHCAMPIPLKATRCAHCTSALAV